MILLGEPNLPTLLFKIGVTLVICGFALIIIVALLAMWKMS